MGSEDAPRIPGTLDYDEGETNKHLPPNAPSIGAGSVPERPLNVGKIIPRRREHSETVQKGYA